MNPLNGTRTSVGPHNKGSVAFFLVLFVLMALFVGVSIGNWINVRQRGNMAMRVSIKESALGQTALEEARYRMAEDATMATCTPGTVRSFTFHIDRSTVTVNVECFIF